VWIIGEVAFEEFGSTCLDRLEEGVGDLECVGLPAVEVLCRQAPKVRAGRIVKQRPRGVGTGINARIQDEDSADCVLQRSPRQHGGGKEDRARFD
jgi:hypothetical protein